MKNDIYEEIEKTKADMVILSKINSEIEKEIELLDIQIKEGRNLNISINCKGIEKKTKINLLKREMEVKKNYLNSILHVSKNIYEDAQLGKTKRIEGLIENINLIIYDINRKSKIEEEMLTFQKEKILNIFK